MNSNIRKLRKDFPIFCLNPEWAYLDTSATSQVPQQVIDAMAEYQCAYRAPVKRGLYKESVRATEAYEKSRVKVADFIGAADPSEIIFTSGATASSNMLVYMLEHTLDLQVGDEIVTSIMEHHSTLVPLQELARRKHITIKYLPLTKQYTLDYTMLDTYITSRTRVVSVMLASNVLGAINHVALIARRAHAVGALMVSDMTAAVGHMPLSVNKLGIDFGYFSGHKMCGPSGIGVLWGRKSLLQASEPGVYGGGMIDRVTREGATWAEVPERFEPGTPNVTGAIGLGAAVDYLNQHNLAHVRTYIEALIKVTEDTLKKIPGVHLYAARPQKNIGVVSFTVEGIHPHDIAEIVGSEGIAIRAGHHCTQPLHEALHVPATARISLYFYNTKRDVDAVAAGIRKAQRMFATHTHNTA